MSKNFIETINAINNACSIMMNECDEQRPPQVFIARALRTIIPVDIQESIEYKNDEELVYTIIQMVIELIISTPIDTEWVISRNSCLPVISKTEKKAIEEYINKVREVNK